ncbi:hypothetical protein NC651_039055 [Populus alba x Populus x berolinensis]|nr:hypothetical protein NC651_039055 [Populus alba x Populus x berolinensis]
MAKQRNHPLDRQQCLQKEPTKTALREREPKTPHPTHFYKERRFHKAKMCYGHSPSKASQALVLIPYKARNSFNPSKVSKITLKQFLTT